MLKEDRRRFISNIVATRGQVSVSDLARELETSEMTIRRNLQALEQQGLIARIHGGALIPAQTREVLPGPVPLLIIVSRSGDGSGIYLSL